ncbi:MAG: MBL fold metallo-hydrolase, partial [Acidimicrobiia bacterium]|nr:MBL fold metallo-hydrolase [Acidimicrobiia bacterium]
MNDVASLQRSHSDVASGRAPARPDPMLEVAPGLACLRLPIVNLYFCGQPGAGDRSWALIDAGLPFSDGRILDAASRRFGPESRPAAIILTHGHFDHVGALPRLTSRWDVPVYAHELERPYLSGLSSYPPP